jgi:hypothetical protein
MKTPEATSADGKAVYESRGTYFSARKMALLNPFQRSINSL